MTSHLVVAECVLVWNSVYLEVPPLRWKEMLLANGRHLRYRDRSWHFQRICLGAIARRNIGALLPEYECGVSICLPFPLVLFCRGARRVFLVCTRGRESRATDPSFGSATRARLTSAFVCFVQTRARVRAWRSAYTREREGMRVWVREGQDDGLEVVRGCWRLLEVVRGWGLLEVVGGCWRLLEVVGG